MKKRILSILTITLYGCASLPSGTSNLALSNKQHNNKQTQTTAAENQCIGTVKLADDLANKFEPITDAALLNKALGSPDKGKLCQGQVYQSQSGVPITIYRAWNSTNPNSKLGAWWAFQIPAGEVSQYRSDYEICYQWSPIDKLVSCTLKPGTKVVVGNGQSAVCSDYLNYPVSAKQQIYIDDASLSVSNCATFNGEFSWK